MEGRFPFWLMVIMKAGTFSKFRGKCFDIVSVWRQSKNGVSRMSRDRFACTLLFGVRVGWGGIISVHCEVSTSFFSWSKIKKQKQNTPLLDSTNNIYWQTCSTVINAKSAIHTTAEEKPTVLINECCTQLKHGVQFSVSHSAEHTAAISQQYLPICFTPRLGTTSQCDGDLLLLQVCSCDESFGIILERWKL